MASTTLAEGYGLDFDLAAHNQFIESHGVDMLHEVSLRCPCGADDVFARNINDGEQGRPLPHCDRCGGDGWLYRAPRLVRGIVSGLSLKQVALEGGMSQPGDLKFTPMIQSPDMEHRKVAQWDKFTSTLPMVIEGGQVITRGAAQFVAPSAASDGMSPDEDRLIYEPEALVHCEDDRGAVYTAADVQLGPGRLVRWMTSHRPPTRSRYTILYRAFLEWITVFPPQEKYDRGGRDLGSVALLRRKHVQLLNRGPLATPDDRVPLKNRIAA